MLRAKLLNDQYLALQAKHNVLISALKSAFVGSDTYVRVLADLKASEEQMLSLANEIVALGPEHEPESGKILDSLEAMISTSLNNFVRICKDVADKNGITKEDVQTEVESFKKMFSANKK